MIERDKGYNGVISFVCDVCDEHYDTYTENFNEALQMVKAKGWKIKKIGDEWIHYCCAECMED